MAEIVTGPGSVAPAALDVVEEAPVWLEINGAPAVTWMCTPDLLDDLVVGWMHGEGFIDCFDDLQSMRPCGGELGFRATIAPERVTQVESMDRRRVLASGCGSVTAMLASLASVPRGSARITELDASRIRPLFKTLFALGDRYKDTGGIHAAALSDGDTILHHAEDIGRHNAVDKVIGAAVRARRTLDGLWLLVTGRISGELAHKAARARVALVATPSVPSSVATDVARVAGTVLVGRAVSGQPQVHWP